MLRKKHKELQPLFYCDNCGAEVSQDTPACSRCGRKFASIRCPACGFSGEEKLFDNGCPECGYQVLPGKGRHKNLHAVRRSRKKDAYGLSASSAPSPNGTLPVWAYFLALALFVFAISFLLFYMGR
jgi:DNA-directed RNA polymerase subunit RPC12/RpoP